MQPEGLGDQFVGSPAALMVVGDGDDHQPRRAVVDRVGGDSDDRGEGKSTASDFGQGGNGFADDNGAVDVLEVEQRLAAVLDGGGGNLYRDFGVAVFVGWNSAVECQSEEFADANAGMTNV